MEDKLKLLLDSYGLYTLLEQNDIEHVDILESLVMSGDINLDDYFYEDMEDVND